MSSAPPGKTSSARWKISRSRRGRELAPRQLRVRVDVPAPREHVGRVGAQPVVQPERAAARTKVLHGSHAYAGVGNERFGPLHGVDDAPVGVAWNIRS